MFDRKNFTNNTILVCLIFVIAVSVGCDNSLDSLNEKDGIYSVYGHLDVHKDVNYIRVKNLNRPLGQDTLGHIDADVRFSNLTKGITKILEDTVVEFDDVKTYNFRTTMDIQPNNKYQVSVENPDGRKISAVATAPRIAQTDVVPTAENCTSQVKLSFNRIKKKLDLDVEIGFEYRKEMFWVPLNRFTENPEDVMSITFSPLEILKSVFGTRDSIWCWELTSKQFKVRYVHYGPDYFENTFNNSKSIPDGVGKFGSFYEDSFSFPIDTVRLCPPDCPCQNLPYLCP